MSITHNLTKEELKDCRNKAEKKWVDLKDEFTRNNTDQLNNYFRGIPDSQKRIFYDSYQGKSKARALKAKCLDCCAFDKIEVKNCIVKTCPLWFFRPYQQKVI